MISNQSELVDNKIKKGSLTIDTQNKIDLQINKTSEFSKGQKNTRFHPQIGNLQIDDCVLIFKDKQYKIKKRRRENQDTKIIAFECYDMENWHHEFSLKYPKYQKFSLKTYYQMRQQLKQDLQLQNKNVSKKKKQEEENLSKIQIQNCLVNIYVLKWLIHLNSQNLTSITLKNCFFYKNDKSVLKQLLLKRIFSSKFKKNKTKNDIFKENMVINTNNNKMLKEINFEFQIKNYQFPQIEEINIELLTSKIKTYESSENILLKNKKIQKQYALTKALRRNSRINEDQKQLYPDQQQQNIEKSINLLVKDYQCSEKSSFVHFSLNIKPSLIEKFKKFQTQSDLFNYLVYGDQEEKSLDQKNINNNILNDLFESTKVFNKYIKGTFFDENMLIIQRNSLENPHAQEMIKNIMIQNKNRIKTVIFKETGTIPKQSFLKIYEALFDLFNLESIAFFDAQPDLDSYQLLKSIIICEKSRYCITQKKSLLIILNRSSFDIQEYHNFEQKKKDQDLVYFTCNTVPKHYSFYILDYQDLYEFTPFEFCIQKLFFPFCKQDEKVKIMQSDLMKYNIGQLIQEQKKYPNKIKQEILKYQNKQILTYSCIKENILIKHFKQENDLNNQQELENDIRTLISHFSFNIVWKIKELINRVEDLKLKSRLIKQFPQFYYEELPGQIYSQESMDNLLLQQQGLLQKNNAGFIIDEEFISDGYPILSKLNYTNAEKIKQNIDIMQQNTIHQLFESEDSEFITKGIKLNFSINKLKISKISKHTKEMTIQKKVFSFNFSNGLLSQSYDQFLQEIVLESVRKDLNIEVKINEELEVRILEKFLKILVEKKKKSLFSLCLNSTSNLPFIFPNIIESINIEKMSLKNLKIDKNSFSRLSNLYINVLDIEYCKIKFFDLSLFKNLKQLKLIPSSQFTIKGIITNLLETAQKIEEQLQSKATQLFIQIYILFSDQYQLEEKMKEKIGLSYDFFYFLLNHKGNIKFQVKHKHGQYFKNLINSSQTDLNFSKINKLYCSFKQYPQKMSFNDKFSSFIEKKQDTNQKQSDQNNIILNQKEDSKIAGCKEVRTIYLQQENQLKFHFQSMHYKMNSFIQNLPNCCIEYLNKLLENSSLYGISDINKISFLKEHSSEFCLFKTSIFQIPFQPKKLEIKFCGNFLVNEPIIYDYKEIEQIEELDFSHNQIVHNLQIQFINYLISRSPNLRVLSFKQFKSSYDIDMEKISLIPLKNKYLKELDLYDTSIDIILPLMEAIINSKDCFALKQLKINPNFEEDNITQASIIRYEKNLKQIIQQNSKSLHLFSFKGKIENICEVLKNCVYLEQLRFEDNNFFDDKQFQVMKIQSLRSISIQSVSQIDKEDFKNFLKVAKQEMSHLQRIYLGNINEQNNLLEQYYRSTENTISGMSKQFQIIQISTDIQVLNYGNSSDDKISMSHYLSQLEGGNLHRLDNINAFQSNHCVVNGLEFLKELYFSKLNSQIDYKFLNNIFSLNKQCLAILSFDKDCQLNNKSLDGVDFSKLPKSIEQLIFCGNKELTSLKFLNPLYKIINDFSNMVLDVDETGISFSEAYKFMPKIKAVIIHNAMKYVYPIVQYVYRNQISTQGAICDILSALFSIYKDQYHRISFINLFLNIKINIENKNLPFISSPFHIMSSEMDFENSGFEVENKLNNFLNLIIRLIDQQQFLLMSILLNKNHKCVFGFSDFSQGGDLHLTDYLQIFEFQQSEQLEHVFLPLTLDVSYYALNNKKLETKIDEITMIENLSRIPPSNITLDNMSIQFIKSWYVINSISPLTIQTTIKNYQKNKIYNNSIGNFFTQKLSRNNFIKSLFNSSPQKFRYDETVQLLAQHFDEHIKKRHHISLMCLFPLYTFFCIFGVVFFSLYYSISCGEGISWYSYCFYLAFGIFTLIIELQIFKSCLNYISHLVPQLEIDFSPGLINYFINPIKKFIINTQWINQWFIGYLKAFILSQLTRFDNFMNVAFLYSTYQCDNYTTFYFSLCFISIPFLYSFYEFIYAALNPTKRYPLPTSSLDTYYKICNIIEFQAVADILDLVSPSNVITIKGRMFNSRIVSNFIRIIGESIPLVIIQIYNLTQNTMNSSLILSLVLSIITFFIKLFNLLTITPSTLNQDDFNQLNQKKIQNQVVEKYNERLQTYEYESFALKFYSHLKQLRLKYIKGKEENNLSPELISKYIENQKFFKILFDCLDLSENNDQQEINLIQFEAINKELQKEKF